VTKRILVTGALGQIGTELVLALRERYGNEAVVASDIRTPPARGGEQDGPFEHLDCTKLQQIQEIVRRQDIGHIYHLAALLSAVGEDKPQSAWHLNMGSLYRIRVDAIRRVMKTGRLANLLICAHFYMATFAP
jgi:nucleoside-diphosphate-sugar epimerase